MDERNTENSQLIESTQNVENGEIDEENENSKFCNPLISIIFLLVIGFLVILGLVIFWKIGGTQILLVNIENHWNISHHGQNICKTPECITLSSTLLNWQDTRIDPCQDFYEYTCGKYPEHSMNDGTRVTEKDTVVAKLIRQFVLKNETSTSKSENDLRLLYYKCDEAHRLEKTDVQEEIHREVFRNIQKIGSWPLADKNWKNSSFNLNEMLSNMASLHLRQFGIFETSLMEAPGNDSSKQLVIIPAITKSGISKEEIIKTIHNILVSNGIDHIKKDLEKEINESILLDEEISNIPMSIDSSPVTLSQLKMAHPKIDFEKIIEKLVNPKTGNFKLLREKITSARFDAFFNSDRNISSIISSRSPRILANFLIFKYVEVAYYYFTLNPQISQDNNFCLEIVTSTFPRASLRVFVRNHFKKENLRVVSEMVEKVKESYVEMLQESTWLQEETRKNAILKVRKMKKLIGYSEEYEEEGALDKMFETIRHVVLPLFTKFQSNSAIFRKVRCISKRDCGPCIIPYDNLQNRSENWWRELQISSNDSFFTLMTKIHRFKNEQLMDYVISDSLLNPIDSLTMANAFYFPTKNLLNILVPFMDKPLFDFEFPQYVSLAGVGRVLAHEIGHAFDTVGRFMDEYGKTREWWTKRDAEMYTKKTKCFVEQFESFKDPSYGGELNGTEVLSEIIADALGSEAIWRTLTKLNLTEESTIFQFEKHDFRKLFFQIGALDFCAPSRISKYAAKYSHKLSHPTNRFRVNGVFSNFKPFSEAFNCPVGSPMNPEKRCELF